MENKTLDKSSTYCVRCESLERPQRGHKLYSIINSVGDKISLCAECLLEIQEEEEYLSFLREETEEDYES
jgi:hypothetical protein